MICHLDYFSCRIGNMKYKNGGFTIMRPFYFSLILLLFLLSSCSFKEETSDDSEELVLAFSNALYEIQFEQIEKERIENEEGWFFHFSIQAKDDTLSLSPESIYIHFPEQLTDDDVTLEKKHEPIIERDEEASHILHLKQFYTGSIDEEATTFSFPAQLHIEKPSRLVYFEELDDESVPIIREELLLESISIDNSKITFQATDVFDIRRTSWSIVVNNERIYPVTSLTIQQSKHQYRGVMEFAVLPEQPVTLVAERLETYDLQWDLDFLLPVSSFPRK